MESSGRLDEAHKEWKQYSDWIARQPQRFPGEFGKRARAMIALRMGDNAADYEKSDNDFSPQSFLDLFDVELAGRSKKKLLKPSAEDCFRTALELAPEWKDPHARLLEFYVEQQQWENAEAVGRRLMQRFPDDSDGLIAFSSVLHAQSKDAEALEALRSALKYNPLDRTLRAVVAQMTLRRGREQTLAGEYDAARASFLESLNLDSEVMAPAARASWAACEFKAGRPEEGRKLASELQSTPQQRLSTAFLMVAETARVKVPKAILGEFKSQFDGLMKDDVSLAEFLQLLMVWNLYRDDGDRYHGFGTHEKRILAKVQQLVGGQLSENDLARLGMALVELRLHKPLKVLADQGRIRFADNPAFRLLQAQQIILQRPKSFDLYFVGATFARVLEQIEGKNEPLHVAMRDLIDRRCEEYPRLREFVDRQREMEREFGRIGGRML
jgi:tetratricopeptide (TPR) repeat protein